MKSTAVRCVLASLISLAAPSARGADIVAGTRGPVVERTHHVDLRFDRGHASLVVTRTVENLGPRHDQAEFELDVPDNSVAVRLRTRGLLDGHPHWFEGDLMEAEAAAARYKELTGIGGYYPKDPALLSWRRQGELALQVFPIAPADRKSVSYTLDMPTTYDHGRHVLRLSRLGTEEFPAKIMVRAARNGDRLFVGNQPFPDGSALVWPEDTEELELALEPKPDLALRFDTTLAVKRFGPQRVLVHYAVRAARRISRVPRDAQVVVVMDFSRSVEQQFAEAEIAAAGAYLHHLPGATVEILTFDRRVRRRLGDFVPAARAVARLGQLAPELGNGSALDTALRDADKLLRGQPSGHARRIVLLTDLRTRSALNPATLRSALRPSGALLHIVTVEGLSDGEGVQPALTRNDEDQRWAPVARATGGLLWSTEINTAPERRGSLERAYEELARPMRVHRFGITVPGVELTPDDGGEILQRAELAEGDTVDGLQIAGTAAPWLELRGELWATPFRTRVAPNAVEAHRWSALAFGSSLLEELTEPEMMVLARYGRAVSPVTSYLAIEPGVRPSTEGLEEGSGYGSGGLGLVGTGSGGGGTGEGQALPPFDPQAWLRDKLRERWRRCAAEDQRATVVLETTDDEIVDVMKVTTSSRGSGACLREATWGLELSDRFTDDRATWTVQL